MVRQMITAPLQPQTSRVIGVTNVRQGVESGPGISAEKRTLAARPGSGHSRLDLEADPPKVRWGVESGHRLTTTQFWADG